MLTYKFTGDNIDRFDFERKMLNAGEGVDPKSYYDFLREKEDHYNYAIQVDIPYNMWETIKLYKQGTGIKNLIPVLHGNYLHALSQIKPLANTLVALGKMSGHIEEDEQIRKLPRTFGYHGLAKGRWIKNTNITSIDSSNWLSAVIGRKADTANGQHVTFGRKGRSEVSTVQNICSIYKTHLNSCNIDIKSVLAGDYSSLLKIVIAIYYKPLFKGLGIYNYNFT